MQGQLTDEAAQALDLDAVEDDQGEHAEGHGQGRVRVGGRHGAERNVRVTGDQDGQLRNPVDRYQVDGVHQEYPDENGQRQRSDYRATAVEGVLHAAVDEVHHHFYEVLQAARLAGSRLLGRHAEDEQEDQTQRDGPTQGVQVERPEAHCLGFCSRMGEAPAAVW
ncbi:hypothetical protein D3C76_1024290 [compost metagenome]